MARLTTFELGSRGVNKAIADEHVIALIDSLKNGDSQGFSIEPTDADKTPEHIAAEKRRDGALLAMKSQSDPVKFAVLKAGYEAQVSKIHAFLRSIRKAEQDALKMALEDFKPGWSYRVTVTDKSKGEPVMRLTVTAEQAQDLDTQLDNLIAEAEAHAAGTITVRSKDGSARPANASN